MIERQAKRDRRSNAHRRGLRRVRRSHEAGSTGDRIFRSDRLGVPLEWTRLAPGERASDLPALAGRLFLRRVDGRARHQQHKTH